MGGEGEACFKHLLYFPPGTFYHNCPFSHSLSIFMTQVFNQFVRYRPPLPPLLHHGHPESWDCVCKHVKPCVLDHTGRHHYDLGLPRARGNTLANFNINTPAVCFYVWAFLKWFLNRLPRNHKESSFYKRPPGDFVHLHDIWGNAWHQ